MNRSCSFVMKESPVSGFRQRLEKFLGILEAAHSADAGQWDTKQFAAAVQWARFCEMIHLKIESADCFELLQPELQTLQRGRVWSLGDTKLNFDLLKHATRVLAKIVVENPKTNFTCFKEALKLAENEENQIVKKIVERAVRLNSDRTKSLLSLEDLLSCLTELQKRNEPVEEVADWLVDELSDFRSEEDRKLFLALAGSVYDESLPLRAIVVRALFAGKGFFKFDIFYLELLCNMDNDMLHAYVDALVRVSDEFVPYLDESKYRKILFKHASEPEISLETMRRHLNMICKSKGSQDLLDQMNGSSYLLYRLLKNEDMENVI